ncbi:hypothetical protein BC834DRAFT_836174 [Gloeopeniophorella convolvens]|nr:hypothetical protein BC834DRAFT_836174 [Gloeopeniophorella convolvens]
MPTDLKGWHPGELAIQRRLAFDEPMAMAWTWIESEMPEQHRVFHSTRLPFLPVTTLDARGRPWGSILTAGDGKPGFIDSPRENRLRIATHLWKGDPLLEHLEASPSAKLADRALLIAGIGIELSTRRRNKMAGWVSNLTKSGNGDVVMDLHVNEAIGNCPKYINVRDLIPHPDTHPTVTYRELDFEGRLPDEFISFIHEADTFFLGSSYVSSPANSTRFPSHVGMNHRGGRPGFVRVRPTDGRTIILPDFSGNRILSSLGNIEATPLASLTIIQFTTGDVLYLTGRAETLVGEEAQKLMPRQNVLTTLEVSGAILVRDAMPMRQRPGTLPTRSSYSPPVKLLAEELGDSAVSSVGQDAFVRLASIRIHSEDLATFEWDIMGTRSALHITAGQTAILDFTALLGGVQYQHMAEGAPSSVNDDRIRTWTISSAHAPDTPVTRFALTMRRKPGGVITGVLFTLAQRLAEVRPKLLVDARDLELRVGLVGVGGSFVLPAEPRALLWAAGGVGVTPFLAMLGALRERRGGPPVDVVFALATREPEVLLPLVRSAIGDHPPEGLSVRLDIFTDRPVPEELLAPRDGLRVSVHAGRIPAKYWQSVPNVQEREMYMCGPQPFEEAVQEGLKAAGADVSGIHKEGFEY